MMSAPAATYSRWMALTMSGCASTSSSSDARWGTPRLNRSVPMAPSSSSGRAASRSAKTRRARERVGAPVGVPSPGVGLIRDRVHGGRRQACAEARPFGSVAALTSPRADGNSSAYPSPWRVWNVALWSKYRGWIADPSPLDDHGGRAHPGCGQAQHRGSALVGDLQTGDQCQRHGRGSRHRYRHGDRELPVCRGDEHHVGAVSRGDGQPEPSSSPGWQAQCDGAQAGAQARQADRRQRGAPEHLAVGVVTSLGESMQRCTCQGGHRRPSEGADEPALDLHRPCRS